MTAKRNQAKQPSMPINEPKRTTIATTVMGLMELSPRLNPPLPGPHMVVIPSWNEIAARQVQMATPMRGLAMLGLSSGAGDSDWSNMEGDFLER